MHRAINFLYVILGRPNDDAYTGKVCDAIHSESKHNSPRLNGKSSNAESVDDSVNPSAKESPLLACVSSPEGLKLLSRESLENKFPVTRRKSLIIQPSFPFLFFFFHSHEASTTITATRIVEVAHSAFGEAGSRRQAFSSRIVRADKERNASLVQTQIMRSGFPPRKLIVF